MTRDLSAGGNRPVAGHFKALLHREMPEFALGEALDRMNRQANTRAGGQATDELDLGKERGSTRA